MYTIRYNGDNEPVDRTESLELGGFDLFLDRVGNLRVYRDGYLLGEYYAPIPPAQPLEEPK